MSDSIIDIVNALSNLDNERKDLQKQIDSLKEEKVVYINFFKELGDILAYEGTKFELEKIKKDIKKLVRYRKRNKKK